MVKKGWNEAVTQKKRSSTRQAVHSSKPNLDYGQSEHEGREDAFMDVDRMINEGLGGGMVTRDNGLIEDTTTDTMFQEESALHSEQNEICRE